jgi:N-acetylglutamate synthase-like GNAT family acetyltransferase
MYVAPTHRGRGLAERIVRALVTDAPEPVLFCLPFAHLSELYQRSGFRPVDPSGPVPEAVAQKLAWCNRTYPDPVVLLRRR